MIAVTLWFTRQLNVIQRDCVVALLSATLSMIQKALWLWCLKLPEMQAEVVVVDLSIYSGGGGMEGLEVQTAHTYSASWGSSTEIDHPTWTK